MVTRSALMATVAASMLGMACAQVAPTRTASEALSLKKSQTAAKKTTMNTKTLVLGGGCFWCIEHTYELLKGVLDVESGYAGGFVTPVTYEQVCSGQTGHAEVVRITYNPAEVEGGDLLRIFFTLHDPPN